MIAIDVTQSAADGREFTVDDTISAVSESPDVIANIYSFFQNCIDENLVLNIFHQENQDRSIRTRYYATTVENAQTFQNAFTNTSVEFSMKKMWAQKGYNVVLEIHEVDFDNEFDTFELIGTENDSIWNTDLLVDNK